jgi:hypothetical protein
MKRIRIVGLCLVAAFALSAIVATSAMAAKHENKGPIKYKSSSGIAFLEIEGGGKVECKTSTAAGEITSATAGTVTATFVGCETLEKKCASAGQTAGTIVTNLLATSTGYVNKAKAEVGTDFKPASGEVLAEFTCKGAAPPTVVNRVKGSVIGRLAPPNEMSTTSKSDLKNSGGKQEVEKFEGGPKDTLIAEISVEGGPFSKAGGIQNVDSVVENTPQEVKKGKKTEKFADFAEVKTGGASPEYGRCRASKKGKYKDGNCTEKVSGKTKGKFEFNPVPF